MRRLLPWALLTLLAGIAALLCVNLAPVRPDAVLPELRREPAALVERGPVDLVVPESVLADAGAAADARRSSEVGKPAPLVASGRITGRILGGWNGDVPLAGAEVTVWMRRVGESVKNIGVTDASGRFVLEGIGFAHWFAEASAPDHGTIRQVVPITPEEPEAELSMQLPRWRDVAVTLVGPEGPLASAETLGLRAAFASALALDIGPPGAKSKDDLSSWTRTGENPVLFEPELPAHTRWQMRAYSLPGDVLHVLLGPCVVASQVLAGPEPIEILVDRRRVQAALTQAAVRVVSADNGQPIPSVDVEFRASNASVGVITTDQHGIAIMRDVPQITLVARARATHHVPASATLKCPMSEPRVMALAWGWVVSGRVASAPKPVLPGESAPDDEWDLQSVVPVKLWRIDVAAELVGNPVQSIAAVDGQFRFEPVTAGRYAVSANFDALDRLKTQDFLEHPPDGVVLLDVVNGDVAHVDVPGIGVQDPEPRLRPGDGVLKRQRAAGR